LARLGQDWQAGLGGARLGMAGKVRHGVEGHGSVRQGKAGKEINFMTTSEKGE